jgi:hypothetical protein
MKNKQNTSKAVAGVIAAPPRPTVLGAALMAAIITFPIGMTILLVDLLLL